MPHLFFCRIPNYLYLPWYIIINPASGPGASGTQPDLNYQQCIPKLHNNTVTILGYVATNYGSGTNVATDIATYAGWDSAYRPNGIFFDEASTSSSDYSTYSSWASSAQSSFTSSAGSGYVSTRLF